jgi:hypothetical protein
MLNVQLLRLVTSFPYYQGYRWNSRNVSESTVGRTRTAGGDFKSQCPKL